MQSPEYLGHHKIVKHGAVFRFDGHDNVVLQQYDERFFDLE